MKFLHLLLFGALPLSVAQAQTAPKKAVAKPVSPAKTAAPTWKLDALPLASLPQVPVEFEFVGTQKDLLGLVQSVARGAASAGGKPISTDMSKRTQLLANAEVLTMLRDVQFLRAQSFNFLKMEQKQDEEREAARNIPESPNETERYMERLKRRVHAVRPKRIDVQEFYAKAFRAQKGQRQFFSSAGDADGDSGGSTTISIWIFDSPGSWALVTQGPSRAIAVRAAGFPRLEALGRLFRLAVSQ